VHDFAEHPERISFRYRLERLQSLQAIYLCNWRLYLPPGIRETGDKFCEVQETQMLQRGYFMELARVPAPVLIVNRTGQIVRKRLSYQPKIVIGGIYESGKKRRHREGALHGQTAKR
jgi:hypothetical protein